MSLAKFLTRLGLDLRATPSDEEELLERVRENESNGAKLEKITISLTEGSDCCVWPCDPFSRTQGNAYEFYVDISANLSYPAVKREERKGDIFCRKKRFYIANDLLYVVDGGCIDRKEIDTLEYYARQKILEESLRMRDWFKNKGLETQIKYKE